MFPPPTLQTAQQGQVMRICVVSERMSRPFDEGIKNYALHLARALDERHTVLTLTTFAETVPSLGIVNVPANRLLLSPWLALRMRRFRPELVIYVPTACATLNSFVRTRLLKAYARGVPVVLISLQLRRHGWLSRRIMPRLRPDLLLVQSEETRASLKPLGCSAQMAPPGIDLTRFRPVSGDERRALRRSSGVDPGDYVICHVGHLKRGRNVQSLLHLQRHPGNQVIVVGSTSTEQERSLVAGLRRGGVRIIDRFLPDIAHVYQMADCYVFPVDSETSSIDVPLSVLEAMACNLPIVTTRFGGLPAFFPATPGFRYAEGLEQMIDAVEASKALGTSGTREMVMPYAWPRVADQMIDMIRGETSLAAT